MAQQVEAIGGGRAASCRASQLSIKVPATRSRRSSDRHVVYIRLGQPPVSTAEVEMMHSYLEEVLVRAPDSLADNDNE